jgi:hypothetical protein
MADPNFALGNNLLGNLAMALQASAEEEEENNTRLTDE